MWPGFVYAKSEKFVVEKGTPEYFYHQEAFSVGQAPKQPLKEVMLTVNGRAFKGDNQKTILEQAEDAGISIANSCRAGLCGACKMTLISGNVYQPDVPALEFENNKQDVVFACCSIPQSDIELVG